MYWATDIISFIVLRRYNNIFCYNPINCVCVCVAMQYLPKDHKEIDPS